MSWSVGEQVVYVDSRGQNPILNYPQVNQIVTIRKIRTYGNGQVSFLLDEVANGLVLNNRGREYEPGFASWRFRKLVRTENGMNLLRGLLNTTSEDDLVPDSVPSEPDSVEG